MLGDGAVTVGDAVRFVGVESKLLAPLDMRDGGAAEGKASRPNRAAVTRSGPQKFETLKLCVGGVRGEQESWLRTIAVSRTGATAGFRSE